MFREGKDSIIVTNVSFEENKVSVLVIYTVVIQDCTLTITRLCINKVTVLVMYKVVSQDCTLTFTMLCIHKVT